MLPPLAAAACALAAALASAATPLRVMGFGGSSNWPLFVAQERGFFGAEGLDVRISGARDSTTQLTDLAEGRIDIAMTAFDNVVAWDERHGEAQALVAFLGVNNGGRSSLIAAPRIGRAAQLRGGRLGVDAAASGYALVLQELLHREGVEPREYVLLSVGGSRQRWEALRDGRVDATLLNAPYDAIAENAGFRRLASSSVLGSYQGSSGAVLRSWAEANAAAIESFIRAYIAGVDWLHDRANQDAAIGILVRHLPDMRREEAQRSYRELVMEPGGFSPRAAFDLEGARTVLALRRAYGGSAQASHDLGYYYDARYYQGALRKPAGGQ